MQENRKVPISRLMNVYDEIDFQMEIDAGREALEMDANFRILLFQIDLEMTPEHDVYGETSKNDLTFKAPVELTVTLSLEPAENRVYNEEQGKVRYMEYGNLVIGVFEDELRENNCDIKYGDIVAYQDTETNLKYFQVSNDGKINSDNPHTAFGYRKFYRTIKAKNIDPNEFNGLL